MSPGSRAPFLLCRVAGRSDVREALRDKGIAVRRGDTFPGLTAEHWRTAVRDAEASAALLDALTEVLGTQPASLPTDASTSAAVTEGSSSSTLGTP